MATIGIIGLILGIVVMIVFAFRGLNAVPLTLLAGAVICIFNGINIWTGFSTQWAAGLGSIFTSYFILFFASSCFANVMESTGACTAIAYKFIDWFGKKHIITVLSLFVLALCYGGVSFFVCMFAVGPIMFKLFEELNVPRKLTIIPIAIGGGAWVLALPGSTQLSNVIPTAMGTSLMAAPVLGYVVGFFGVVVSLLWSEREFKKQMALVASGAQPGWDKSWEGASGFGPMKSRDEVPGTLFAFVPIVVLVAIIIICSSLKVFSSSTMLACLAMAICFIICFVLNYKYIPDNKIDELKKMLTKGASGAAGSALALGAVVGFGTIVSNTGSFQNIVQWLINLNINTYWKAVISTSIIAGISGSASSGTRLCIQYLGDYFVNSGSNLDIIHRLIALSSITFDSLPHASGCFIMFAYFGLNHKNAYKYTFVLDTMLTLIAVVIATLVVTLFGL